MAALHVERKRLAAVLWLQLRFQALVGGRLGRKWYQHFDAWLVSAMAASAPAASGEGGKGGLSVVPSDPVLPTSGAGAGAGVVDAELLRKLGKTGMSVTSARQQCVQLSRWVVEVQSA